MENTFNFSKEYFDVFVEDRKIPDPDELLGRAIKYLISKGKDISLVGFNDYGVPVLNIDKINYLFNAYSGMWDFARFTMIDNIDTIVKSPQRISKIESFYK